MHAPLARARSWPTWINCAIAYLLTNYVRSSVPGCGFHKLHRHAATQGKSVALIIVLYSCNTGLSSSCPVRTKHMQSC